MLTSGIQVNKMQQKPEETLKEVTAGINERNTEKVIATLAEDVNFQDPFTASQLRGKEAVKQHLKVIFAAFPDMRAERGRGLVTNELAALEFTTHATHAGPLPLPEGKILPPTNARFTLDGALVLHYNSDGKIQKFREYADSGSFLRQIGTRP